MFELQCSWIPAPFRAPSSLFHHILCTPFSNMDFEFCYQFEKNSFVYIHRSATNPRESWCGTTPLCSELWAQNQSFDLAETINFHDFLCSIFYQLCIDFLCVLTSFSALMWERLSAWASICFCDRVSNELSILCLINIGAKQAPNSCASGELFFHLSVSPWPQTLSPQNYVCKSTPV